MILARSISSGQAQPWATDEESNEGNPSSTIRRLRDDPSNVRVAQ
jgi:hypothetical protein